MLRLKRNIIAKVIVLLLVLLSFNGVAFATVGMSESEPNDIVLTATVIPSDFDLTQEISASIGNAGDVDYYTFTPVNSGGYSIETLGSTNTYGYLYDSNMNLLDVCDNQIDPDSINCELRVELAVNNTYYVKITHTNTTDTGDYRLKITPVIYANKEIEPNGSIATATSPTWRECDYPTAAEIGTVGDEDYFEFSITDGGNFTFETIGTTDVQGYLYDSNYNQIASDNDSGDGTNMKIVYNLSSYQTYYVKICHGLLSGTGSYGLKYTPPDNASSVADNEGNDFSSATQLSTNNIVSYYGLGINNANDVDFYTFTPSADGIYTFQTLGNFDTSGEVYDNNQNLLKSDDNSGVDNNFSIYVPLTANQTYYLKVAASNSGATGTYSVDIAMGRCLEVPIYMQQPYDSLCWAASSAMAISYFNNDYINRTAEIGQWYAQTAYSDSQLLFGDNYYTYPSVFNQQAYLATSNDYMNSCIAANVEIHSFEFDSPYPGEDITYPYTLNTLKKSIDNGFPLLVKNRTKAGGYHMILIKGYKECSDGINVIYNDPLEGECMSNYRASGAYTTFYPRYEDIESNNTKEDASDIKENQPIQGSIGSSGDVDYYKFTAEYNYQYKIETTGTTDTYGELYDRYGIPLQVFDDNEGEGNNFKIISHIIPQNEYYIKVRHSGTGTGNYTLNLEKVPPPPAE